MIIDLFRREAIYLWYYYSIQFQQIAAYWLLGIFTGSLVSVFLKKYIHQTMRTLRNKRMGIWGTLRSHRKSLSPSAVCPTSPARDTA